MKKYLQGRVAREERFLYCVRHFGAELASQMKVVFKRGRFEVLEWQDTLNHRGWSSIASHLNEDELEVLARHLRVLGKAGPLACAICGQDLAAGDEFLERESQLWACMNRSCADTHGLSHICEYHLAGGGAQGVAREDKHMIMCFKREGGRWSPKNIFRQCAHLIEAKAYTNSMLEQFLNFQMISECARN